MKLINKKTGEVGKLHCDMNVSPTKYGVFEDTDIRGHYWEYDSLAELNEEWEDCNKPAEPLIKDEKIRKAVRAWAEAECIEKCYYRIPDTFESIEGIAKIEFGVFGFNEGLYTIAELCGEEEE